jgi:hypothetical protein
MALDLITASGGSPEPAEGPVLSAGFPNAQSALLTVRRLQCALQGLVEGGSSRNVTAAMLIRSADDQAGGSIQAALENAAPGQILLSSGIAESVNQVPNVTLRRAAQGGWSEMLWRSSETDASSAADEQSLLRLIRELGREDPSASQPQVSVSAPPQASTAQTPASPMATGSFTPGRAHLEDELTSAGRNKKWIIIGGAAAALVIAGVLVISSMVSGNHARTQPPPQPPSAPSSSKPVEPETPPTPVSPPSETGNQGVTTTSGSPQKPPRGSGTSSSTKPKTDANLDGRLPPAGHCDLTDADIQRALGRADSNLHAGKLSEAQAGYESVLRCPSARQRAAEGLQRVKQQRLAMGGSNQ